jgi:hypothetical protein
MTSDTNHTLITGQAYDIGKLRLLGWTDGDGSGVDGYRLSDYFDPAGTYIGPDQHGIEPIVMIAES